MKRLARMLGLGARVLASNIRRSPLPFKLTFIVTYRCDCRCQMCNIWMRKVENEMTADGYTLVTWRRLWLEPKTHRFAPSMR